MLDLRWIRENPRLLDTAMINRGCSPVADSILAIDSEYRSLQTRLQEMQAKSNAASSAIGGALSKGNSEIIDEIRQSVAGIKNFIQELESIARAHRTAFDARLAEIPNIPMDDVPVGADESCNVELHRWGAIPEFTFNPRQHFELGIELGMMDFEVAARISGARFVILKGGLARLERALGQFMIDLHISEHGYQEVSIPFLVRSDAAYGTANLPKFADDLFQTTNGYWLIPTAEVSLTNTVREQIIVSSELPLRLVALSPCFRSESGAAGRDTRGMIRMHQFMKVELVSITHPEDSSGEHLRMLESAENVLKKLQLPFRTVTLCTGDMGFASQKTYDIEVWLPGQGVFREISSCSNCGSFQARRMNARYRRNEVLDFVHTLNCSGLAVGRTLVAVIENYQMADGSIRVPEVLVPYMGCDVIQA